MCGSRSAARSIDMAAARGWGRDVPGTVQEAVALDVCRAGILGEGAERLALVGPTASRRPRGLWCSGPRVPRRRSPGMRANSRRRGRRPPCRSCTASQARASTRVLPFEVLATPASMAPCAIAHPVRTRPISPAISSAAAAATSMNSVAQPGVKSDGCENSTSYLP